jgi:hypothetical protein
LHLVIVLASSYDNLPIQYPRSPLSEAHRTLSIQHDKDLDKLGDIDRALVDQAFDTRVYKRFRQVMPLIKIDMLGGQDYRNRLQDFVEDMDLCEKLALCRDLDVWEVSQESAKRTTVY